MKDSANHESSVSLEDVEDQKSSSAWEDFDINDQCSEGFESVKFPQEKQEFNASPNKRQKHLKPLPEQSHKSLDQRPDI